MKTIIEFFNALAEKLSNVINDDLYNDESKFYDIFKSYNYWQEQECDSANYIFDIEDNNDLSLLVSEGWFNAKDIYNYVKAGVRFITIDEKNNLVTHTKSEVTGMIMSNMDSIVRCMLLYIARCGGDSPYGVLYEKYVTSVLEADNFYEK